MKYDLRTCDSSYDFIVDFMNMISKEYLDEWIIGCKKDFDIFWKRNYDKIAEVDILKCYTERAVDKHPKIW